MIRMICVHSDSTTNTLRTLGMRRSSVRRSLRRRPPSRTRSVGNVDGSESSCRHQRARSHPNTIRPWPIVCTSDNCSRGVTTHSGDQMAKQMVNFAYLIGDRETGEAVVVDPAYGIDDILAVLEADGMRLVGALGTHYHADHIGGSMMGFEVVGIADLLERVIGADPHPT